MPPQDNAKIIQIAQPASVVASTTGNTAVIAAPGTNNSIRIHALYLVALTTTANQLVSFNENTTTAGPFFTNPLDAKKDQVYLDFPRPWVLNKDTALNINLGQGGAIHVSALYEIEDRT